jgi:hypothetical protein
MTNVLNMCQNARIYFKLIALLFYYEVRSNFFIRLYEDGEREEIARKKKVKEKAYSFFFIFTLMSKSKIPFTIIKSVKIKMTFKNQHILVYFLNIF